MYKKFTPNELNKMNHKTFPGSEGCLIPFISRIFLLYRKQANKIEFTAFLSYRKQRLQIRIFPWFVSCLMENKYCLFKK